MKAQNLLWTSTAIFLDTTCSIREGDLPVVESQNIIKNHIKNHIKINIQIALNNALETLSSAPSFHSKSAVSRARERSFLGSMTLGIKKGHCDVAGSFGGWKTFMVVGQASWMHKGPPFPWSSNGAVVAQEPAASSLVGTQETYQLGTRTSGKGSLPSDSASENVRRCLGNLLCSDAFKNLSPSLSQSLIVILNAKMPYVDRGRVFSCSKGLCCTPDPLAHTHLIVDANSVQGDVDGEGGRVVVGHQGRLLVRFVANHKGQFKLGLREKNKLHSVRGLWQSVAPELQSRV